MSLTTVAVLGKDVAHNEEVANYWANQARVEGASWSAIGHAPVSVAKRPTGAMRW